MTTSREVKACDGHALDFEVAAPEAELIPAETEAATVLATAELAAE